MNIWKPLFSLFLVSVLLVPVASAARKPMTLELRPDVQNPESPIMGNHLTFWSTITNPGATAIEGLVAWISLVEIDPGNEQPMDLEDWSAHKAVSGATLGPGQSLRTNWPMRLIRAGDYRVVVSVIDRGSPTVFTSPAIQFHVRQKPVLQSTRILMVAVGIPLLFAGLLIINRARRGHGKTQT